MQSTTMRRRPAMHVVTLDTACHAAPCLAGRHRISQATTAEVGRSRIQHQRTLPTPPGTGRTCPALPRPQRWGTLTGEPHS